MTVYHCTWTRLVDRIYKQGLRTMQASNWKVASNGTRYGAGATFAFTNRWDAIRWAAKMDWDHFGRHATGEVTILTLEHEGPWITDSADPLSQAMSEGPWLKTYHHVPAAAIVDAELLTGAIVKALVKRTNQRYQEVK